MDVVHAESQHVGDLTPAEIAAEVERDHLALAVAESRERRLEIGPEAALESGVLSRRSQALDRALVDADCGGPGGVPARLIDHRVVGDRDQPRADAAPRGVEPLPGAKRALEGHLREVVDVGVPGKAVREIAVDTADVLVIGLDEVFNHGQATRFKRTRGFPPRRNLHGACGDPQGHPDGPMSVGLRLRPGRGPGVGGCARRVGATIGDSAATRRRPRRVSPTTTIRAMAPPATKHASVPTASRVAAAPAVAASSATTSALSAITIDIPFERFIF